MDGTITVWVDMELYEAAAMYLAELQSTPEEYVRLCLIETVAQKEQLLEAYQSGVSPKELLAAIADQVMDTLERRCSCVHAHD